MVFLQSQSPPTHGLRHPTGSAEAWLAKGEPGSPARLEHPCGMVLTHLQPRILRLRMLVSGLLRTFSLLKKISIWLHILSMV